MFTGRTLSIIAVISFCMTMLVWVMNENRNTKIRGELIDKAIAEAQSNINFLKTGQHLLEKKDYVDSAISEIQTGGVPQLDSRWLGAIAAQTQPLFILKDDKLEIMKKLMEKMEQYNSAAAYAAQSSGYSDDSEDEGSSYQPPQALSKEQMLSEIAGFTKLLNEGKEHGNNFNY